MRDRMRAARTPLFSTVRRLMDLARLASRPHSPPVDELVEMDRLAVRSRRDFLKTSAAVLPVGLRGRKVPARSSTRSQGKARAPRIVIVGAGIAGLNAAFVLRRAGHRALIFSADERLGGRIVSAQNLLAPGLTTELGGEFINTDDLELRGLVSELGLELIDLQNDDNLRTSFFFGGTHLSETQVIAAFRPLARRIAADLHTVPRHVSFSNQTPAAVRLDRLSLEEYLAQAGVTGALHDLLRSAYLGEEGLELDQQSALNLLLFIDTDTRQGFRVYGSNDERFKVKGGNQQVIHGLASLLAGQVQQGRSLTSIRSRGTGFDLSFETQAGPRTTVSADFVILALPFSILRRLDVQVALPGLKRRAIQELGYGMNTKVMLGARNRVWRALGYLGDAFTDESFQGAWDNSELEPGTEGGLTLFPGGRAAIDAGRGTAADQVKGYLPGVDRLFPGVGAQFNGNVARAYWPGDPFVHASYSAYKPGQYTSIGGVQSQPVGNLYFAGEHCNHPDLGFMNGAAVTGRIAAQSILARLRL